MNQADLDDAREAAVSATNAEEAAAAEIDTLLARRKRGEVLAPARGWVIDALPTAGSAMQPGGLIARIAAAPAVIRVAVPERHLGAKFTATSMIGFIALAGATVREAVIEAGAVRFRPILLTAVTAMIGALFIIVAPIFKGLATSLFFGLISSTLLTTLAVPALYIWRRSDDHDPLARAAG